MSDLINRNETYKILISSIDWLREQSYELYCTIGDSIRCCIDGMQTYDINKIIQQLEEEREISCADFDRYVDEVTPWLDAEYDDLFHRGLERAVKIMKGRQYII